MIRYSATLLKLLVSFIKDDNVPVRLVSFASSYNLLVITKRRVNYFSLAAVHRIQRNFVMSSDALCSHSLCNIFESTLAFFSVTVAVYYYSIIIFAVTIKRIAY